MSTTRISELSSVIAAGTATIDAYHASKGLPGISFAPDTPPKFPYPPEVAQARLAVLEASDELHALLAGPAETWIKPHHTTHIVHNAIYRFKIANAFPQGKDEATYEEMAKECGLREEQVRRIVRLAMTYRIFKEVREGVVGHTVASKFLATNPMMQQWVGMVTEDLWPAATRMVDAMSKWPGSNEPNEAGYNIAHSTDKPIFAFLADKPERAQRFADAMSLFNTGEGFEPEHLLDHYPWGELGKATVVDVGGSHGPVAISIAERFPNIECIVQDRPEVVKSAEAPPALADRVTFQAHDFFTEQPVKGADVYYFRWIFHDWADKYAAKILKALIPALKPGARIVISEFIVPNPGLIPTTMERDIRSFDLAMWEFQNAKEREVGDWISLFAQADPRFQFVGVTMPPTSKLGIIEAKWSG